MVNIVKLDEGIARMPRRVCAAKKTEACDNNVPIHFVVCGG